VGVLALILAASLCAWAAGVEAPPEGGLTHGPLLLPQVAVAQTLPLSAFGVPPLDWRAGLWTSCEQGAMPVGTPLELASLELRAEGLFAAGELLLPLQGGRPPEDGDLDAHVALRDQLEGWAAASRYALERDCAPWLLPEQAPAPLDRLLLLADRDMPLDLVRLVAWEARRAGFARLAVAVRGPAQGPWRASGAGPGVALATLSGADTVGALLGLGSERSGTRSDPELLPLRFDLSHAPAPGAAPVPVRRSRLAGVIPFGAPLLVSVMELDGETSGAAPRLLMGRGLRSAAPRDRLLPELVWGEIQARGGLDAVDVLAHLRENEHRLEICYGQGLQRDPTLAGALGLRFEVDERGRTRALVVLDDGLGDEGTLACVQALLMARGWSALHPQGVTEVEIGLTFQPRAAGTDQPAGP
jgi:hypothetical protein